MEKINEFNFGSVEFKVPYGMSQVEMFHQSKEIFAIWKVGSGQQHKGDCLHYEYRAQENTRNSIFIFRMLSAASNKENLTQTGFKSERNLLVYVSENRVVGWASEWLDQGSGSIFLQLFLFHHLYESALF